MTNAKLDFPELDERRARGRLERATNAQQRRLLRAYDPWARATLAELERARQRYASQQELRQIVEKRLAILEPLLGDKFRRGILDAEALVLKRRPPPLGLDLLTARRVAETNQLLHESLIPSMRNLMIEAIASGEPKALAQQLTAMRSRPAAYAGGYWAMIFETQGLVIKEKDIERRQEGKGPQRVKWNLDPDAEHCVARPGYYGCPDLAGIYATWDDMPTVPAGRVSCLGNCRCFISVEVSPDVWRHDI